MFLPLSLLLLTGAPAEAAHPTLPSRPMTYPVDTNLSEGPVEGLRELYADPYTLKDKLKPVKKLPLRMVRVKPKVLVTKERVVINDKIQFALDSAEIQADSHALLDAVAESLAGNEAILTLRVEGHTDAQGADDYNKDLSERRAASVKAYLEGKGVDAERLSSVGFGESVLLDDSGSDEAHAKNRRVQLMIETWDEDALAELEGEDGSGLMQADEAIAQFADERQKAREAATPSSGALPIVNETMAWAKITVGDVEVGVIGPLTNSVIKDLEWGAYDVTFENSTGYVWTQRSRTIEWTEDDHLIPGGRPAQVSVDEGIVPSWHDDPTKGHVTPERKKRRAKK